MRQKIMYEKVIRLLVDNMQHVITCVLFEAVHHPASCPFLDWDARKRSGSRARQALCGRPPRVKTDTAAGSSASLVNSSCSRLHNCVFNKMSHEHVKTLHQRVGFSHYMFRGAINHNALDSAERRSSCRFKNALSESLRITPESITREHGTRSEKLTAVPRVCKCR